MIQKLINLTKLKSSPEKAFVLGFVYAIMGTLVAFFLFPSYIGIVSVFFTSMAIMPLISRLIEEIALKEGREREIKKGGITLTEFHLRSRKFSAKGLWQDNKHLIQVYLFSFFGIFLLFSAIIFVLPQKNGDYEGLINITLIRGGEEIVITDEYILKEQFEAYDRIRGKNTTGDAIGSAVETNIEEQCFLGDCEKFDFFIAIIKNNLWVLIVMFLVSLIYGFGAMFIITWNASVWGMVFANRSLELAPIAGKNPIVFFGLLMLNVLPHTALEALTYFTAAISGGIASQGITKEGFESERFERILTHAFILIIISLILLILAAFTETYVFSYIESIIPKY